MHRCTSRARSPLQHVCTAQGYALSTVRVSCCTLGMVNVVLLPPPPPPPFVSVARAYLRARTWMQLVPLPHPLARSRSTAREPRLAGWCIHRGVSVRRGASASSAARAPAAAIVCSVSYLSAQLTILSFVNESGWRVSAGWGEGGGVTTIDFGDRVKPARYLSICIQFHRRSIRNGMENLCFRAIGNALMNSSLSSNSC